MTTTLAEAQEQFKAKLDVGTPCPCCGRFAKRYRRKLNSSMAASLIALVRLSNAQLVEETKAWQPGGALPSPWVHADAVGVALKSMGSRASYPHGELGKLVHWGLVAMQPGKGAHTRTSGFWMPTPYGVEFVNRTARVKRIVILWDNTVEGFEGPEVSIDVVMNDHFDFASLMGNEET